MSNDRVNEATRITVNAAAKALHRYLIRECNVELTTEELQLFKNDIYAGMRDAVDRIFIIEGIGQ
jgi:hypothetical protein